MSLSPDQPAPRERPLERRSAARTAVVWDAVAQWLGDRREQRVVDIGGGTGGFAVRVAALGHHVTVVDPSPDALAALDRRAHDHGVADRVTGRQGDLSDVPALFDPDGSGMGGVDLVLCHGVLGILEDPAAALEVLAGLLAPGGALSLLVGQRHAAVLNRAMAGHFAAAQALLADEAPEGERRFTAAQVTDLLTGAGLEPVRLEGVRVFADLVPSGLLDLEPGASTALLELERAVAGRPEYLTLAAQVHALAQRR